VYKIFLEKSAEIELCKIPHSHKLLIRIKSYLSQSPHELGKAPTGEYRGQYRYRYSDYRIIYIIDKENERVIILRIRHRKNAY
jgi:mRNA interferase RelE/StbE